VHVARIYTLVPLFTALTAAGAFIKIPTPIVPITLQTLMVILSGLVLGARGGALSQLLYVFMGLLGLPLFSGGGGPAYVFSPTFGYLVGFVVAAAVVGFFAEKGGNRWPILGIFASIVIMYACGVPYLYLSMNCFLDKPITFLRAVEIGALLPLFGDVLKAVIAILIFCSLRKIVSLPVTGHTRGMR
jgi:biotin transport system substrate-specific component